jgi:hypothetical protein
MPARFKRVIVAFLCRLPQRVSAPLARGIVRVWPGFTSA